jgi:hypothetical protein
MTFSTSLTNTLWRSALALVALTGFLVAATETPAAGPRPLFQMPVPCGQTWEASTYAKHWNGNPNAIDLAQRDEDGNNISEGEPALASAAGTVLKVFKTKTKGENRVYIDHGDGWRTDYVHLESVPPLTVGQHVAQGEMVGRISNSGAKSMHLHYNQMKDGVPARVSFNGKLIDTFDGNPDAYDSWGTDRAEKLTSLNCPGDSFVPFVQNGMHYQLLYKPASGEVKVQRLDADGTGTTSVWDGTWLQRYTNLVPFTLYGGQQHLFAYQASTGKVRFDRMNGQGEGTTMIANRTWGKGWTHFMPFSLGGRPYFIAYDSLRGNANIERVNGEGNGSTTIYSHTWDEGWTHFTPYVSGGVQYMLIYKGGTGQVEIDKVTGSGDNVSLTHMWSDTWSPGWSYLVPLKHNGSVHLFAYRAATGEVSYNKLKTGGQGTQHLGSATWTTTWTAFTPFLQDGDGALFAYKAGTGTAQVRLLNEAGSGSSEIWTGGWTTGWS